MEAELLKRPPISGQFEEHNFSLSGNTLWVKFFDSDYLEWVGVFSQSGWSSFNTVVRVPNEELFLVVAGGQGYFVNPNKRTVVSQTDWEGISDIIFNEATNSFIATDGLCLGVLKGASSIWHSERISADGITFTGQEGEVVKGILNDLTAEGSQFTFNINTKIIEAEWIFSENWG